MVLGLNLDLGMLLHLLLYGLTLLIFGLLLTKHYNNQRQSALNGVESPAFIGERPSRLQSVLYPMFPAG